MRQDKTLVFDRPVETARIFGGDPLERLGPSSFRLPVTKGRLLVEIPGFWQTR